MQRQLLTDFELMILLAMLRAGVEAYGVRIAREIEETGGRRVVMGAVYTALERLERHGLVSSSVGDPTLGARRPGEAVLRGHATRSARRQTDAGCIGRALD